MAQESEEPPKIWTSEISLNAVSQSGNTDTNDFGVAAKVERDIERVRHFAQLTFDYGDTEGEETKNRTFASYQQDRVFNDRWFGFGQVSVELDEFDGFDYRALLNAGVGYDVIDTDVRNWTVRGGPGVRFEQVETDEDANTEFALFAGSRFQQQINDAVALDLINDVTWTSETSTFFNSAALSAELTNGLSARFSYDVIYETNPPVGAEETDTIARAALVFSRQ